MTCDRTYGSASNYQARRCDCDFCPFNKKCVPSSCRSRMVLIVDGYCALLRARRKKRRGLDNMKIQSYLTNVVINLKRLASDRLLLPGNFYHAAECPLKSLKQYLMRQVARKALTCYCPDY